METSEFMMGKIRTPRPIYQSGYVLEFHIKNKEIFYKISKWNKEETNQGYLQKGKLGDQEPQKVFDSAIQNFSTVSKNG